MSIALEEITVLSADFSWRYPYRGSSILRIEYVTSDMVDEADDEPDARLVAVFRGEQAIRVREALRERGTDVPIADDWHS
jgi:hypothetical protein